MKPVNKEKALNLLEDFLEDAEESLVIVEGKKDRQSLELLGVPAENILEINKGHNLADFSQKIKHDKVIILTDSDRTGANLKKELQNLLRMEGKKTNTEYRLKFLHALGVKFIENLYKAYEKLEEH